MTPTHPLAHLALIGAITSLPSTAATQPTSAVAAIDLAGLLPKEVERCALKPVGQPQQVEGEQLYELINGGAGLYLRMGFQRAATLDYESGDGTLFNLEVYDMGAPDNAREIFRLKGGKPGAKPTAAPDALLEDYYGLFWQDRYFISVTAAEGTDENRALLTRLAQTVVRRIKERDTAPSATPDREETIEREKVKVSAGKKPPKSAREVQKAKRPTGES